MRYRDAQVGRDIAVSCHIEANSTWILKLWKWNESSWNKLIVKIFLMIHILISFFEPSSLDDLKESGMPSYCVIVEMLCLVVEFQDAIGKTILSWHGLSVRDKAIDDFRNRLVIAVLLDFMLVSVFVDVLLAATLRFSYQFYIPLKVLIILLEVAEVR